MQIQIRLKSFDTDLSSAAVVVRFFNLSPVLPLLEVIAIYNLDIIGNWLCDSYKKARSYREIIVTTRFEGPRDRANHNHHDPITLAGINY